MIKEVNGIVINSLRIAAARTILPILALLGPRVGIAEEQEGVLRVQTSLYTRHYSPDPEHVNRQKLVNLEWTLSEEQVRRFDFLRAPDEPSSLRNRVEWLAGGAYFQNSFGQDSLYGFVGGRYPVSVARDLDVYFKLTAGFLAGYRGEYKDKIPFNNFGVAPAVLPSVGIEYKRFHLEVVPFGTAGFMVNAGWRF